MELIHSPGIQTFHETMFYFKDYTSAGDFILEDQ